MPPSPDGGLAPSTAREAVVKGSDEDEQEARSPKSPKEGDLDKGPTPSGAQPAAEAPPKTMPEEDARMKAEADQGAPGASRRPRRAAAAAARALAATLAPAPKSARTRGTKRSADDHAVPAAVPTADADTHTDTDTDADTGVDGGLAGASRRRRVSFAGGLVTAHAEILKKRADRGSLRGEEAGGEVAPPAPAAGRRKSALRSGMCPPTIPAVVPEGVEADDDAENVRLNTVQDKAATAEADQESGTAALSAPTSAEHSAEVVPGVAAAEDCTASADKDMEHEADKGTRASQAPRRRRATQADREPALPATRGGTRARQSAASAAPAPGPPGSRTRKRAATDLPTTTTPAAKAGPVVRRSTRLRAS